MISQFLTKIRTHQSRVKGKKTTWGCRDTLGWTRNIVNAMATMFRLSILNTPGSIADEFRPSAKEHGPFCRHKGQRLQKIYTSAESEHGRHFQKKFRYITNCLPGRVKHEGIAKLAAKHRRCQPTDPRPAEFLLLF